MIKMLGLWTACFNNFGYDRDALGKMYDGCHWIYSYEYKPIFAWLVPNWFLAVQVMMTLGLIINGGMALMLLTGQAGFFMDKEDFFAQAFKAGGFWTSFLLTCLSVALFGIKSDIDRQWFPRPDQNYLSWSFAFVVIAGFFEIFAAMCLTFDALRIKDVEARRLKKQDPGYMGYKMGPVVTHPQLLDKPGLTAGFEVDSVVGKGFYGGHCTLLDLHTLQPNPLNTHFYDPNTG
ncbi:hypothetical protein MAR_030845 [Mya arenaria]|uniref:Uncharacterized protein n=1 Tax=Mya arenaria TaxID=6604 RepID=A0ABY7F604_MYAAR|nr:hypothetical protein MAR_030845 [Mya arenaria]